MNKIKSVLFVCTGNSCRSIMAEGLLRKYLKDAGKDDIEVHSAGIMPVGGMTPTSETIEVMKKEGVDVSEYRSRYLTAEMIRKADLILVMESFHKNEVLNRVPEASAKTFLLKEFGNTAEQNPLRLGVKDPIGKPIEDYRHALVTIKNEIERIANLL